MQKLLLVDDQEHVLSGLELLFELHEIPTARAAGHEEALRAVRKGDIGVVLQDMNFTRATTSGEEGVALFHDIRELDDQMPVILMTAFGYDPNHCVVRASQEGLQAVLFKPFKASQLIDAIRKAFATE